MKKMSRPGPPPKITTGSTTKPKGPVSGTARPMPEEPRRPYSTTLRRRGGQGGPGRLQAP